ncbi:MAG TPA: histidine kinase [Ferruginibacter sp.]|nr:histidine kinase [Ferruginibacter sp.]HRO05204.1 histidine kinase [Ferruginibacter sp.]HRO95491.1 histidine kinase [Ferruginibacter sp.]HRP49923.1 histidine kinase [Ferruginibacter sp.]
MLKKISAYWWCQIIGWSANIAISIFFVLTFGIIDDTYVLSLLSTCILGIFVTHIMRYNIFYFRVLEKPLKTQILYFLALTLVFSVILGIVSESMDYLIGYNPERLQKFSRAERLFLSSFNALWLIFIWNLIYYMYHFVESNRRQQIDKIRLENLVKTLELKTIKSHINPHFIFNSLNSIRALVDENPQRARKAITELSNILRSSLQTEKLETVPFEKELGIVKDYLELEQMRFEERLKVEFHIDPATLVLPIPPMMLQTLSENAIKHGISKSMDGGTIRIISKIRHQTHEIIVQNTGKLNGNIEQVHYGFGIKSTIDRLNLLFQHKASFSISDTDRQMVETKIEIPIHSD